MVQNLTIPLQDRSSQPEETKFIRSSALREDMHKSSQRVTLGVEYSFYSKKPIDCTSYMRRRRFGTLE